MREFKDLPPAEVERQFAEGVASFDGAKIRTYVPILAGKLVRDTLSRTHPVGTPTSTI